MHTGNTARSSFLVLLVLLFVAAACWGEEPSPSEQVVITFGCREWQESIYRDLADRFEAANPDVRVQLVLMESTSDLRADTWVGSIHPALTQQGLVRDLTPFIEADRAFRPEGFYPHALEGLQWDGGTWGFGIIWHFMSGISPMEGNL